MLMPDRLMLAVCCLFLAQTGAAAEPLPAGVVCLLEDNAAELLPLLSNPGGDLGEGEVEHKVVFSGRSAVKITSYQKYFNLLPGWAHRIAEKPAAGEYRYLRFAWKSAGLTGIMLQLHDARDWHIRYVAGANKFGWAANQVAESPPPEWTLVTLDLFKDFGEREIHGIALTAFDGAAGYFDHIYLGRTIDDLDAIDATGRADAGPIQLTPAEVDKHLEQLRSADGSIAYRAFWTLAAGDGSVRALLAGRTSAEPAAKAEPAAIEQWLRDLNADEFDVREKATMQLAAHLAAYRERLEEELRRTTSAESRARLAGILAAARKPLTDYQRTEQQIQRILQTIKRRQG